MGLVKPAQTVIFFSTIAVTGAHGLNAGYRATDLREASSGCQGISAPGNGELGVGVRESSDQK